MWAISPGVLLPIPEHHCVLLPQGAEERSLLPTGQQVHERCKGWIFHLPDHRDGQGTLRGNEKRETCHTRWNSRTMIKRRLNKAKHKVLPLDQGNPKAQVQAECPCNWIIFKVPSNPNHFLILWLFIKAWSAILWWHILLIYFFRLMNFGSWPTAWQCVDVWESGWPFFEGQQP